MPEISVIVPVYKAEEYLHRCVGSILDQTFTDFELILVNDGSPDNSGAICDEYAEKDTRVRVIHQKNGGVSSARNAGLDVANGNWVTFVDSDDYLASSYLGDIYQPEYDITVIGHEIDGIASDPKGYLLKPCVVNVLSDTEMAKILELNGKYWAMFCWGRLIRKELLLKNNIRFEQTLRCGEDYLFTAECLSACKSLCLKEEMSYIHTNRGTGSLSKTFDIPFFENLVTSERLVGQVLSLRFPTSFQVKTEEELTHIFADRLFDIAADSSFSFRKKYQVFRYLFHTPQIKLALNDTSRFFPGVSGRFVAVLRLKNPLLTLVGLMFSAGLKKPPESTRL